MRKLLLLSICLIAFIFQAQAQIPSDRISFGQGNFFLNGGFITFKQAREIMSVDPEASLLMKRARTNKTWSSVLSYPGYFLLGWGIGGLLGSVPFSETAPFLGIGAGLVAGSLLLDAGFIKNSDLAVNVYNSSIPMGSKPLDFQLLAGMTSTGVGLKITF
ncbi:hypothetical protein [Mongoliitalea daihaiensis]|uniref:hypothetical protein n=1 Tax=Mongoliitalea daihaiensis TaxID=2782006 RepID=UPI001F2B6790|nr:hypothetical protein [Mongoliitalea daihaiensis]UJP64101.1 hypothetical protein IPZ59_14945 [Mongoliitalea daihaiensis]